MTIGPTMDPERFKEKLVGPEAMKLCEDAGRRHGVRLRFTVTVP